MRNKIFIPVLIFIFTISNLLADDDGLNNYKNKKFEEAKSYYEQILLAKENDAAASLGLGASQYQLGDIPNAAKSFEEALKSMMKSAAVSPKSKNPQDPSIMDSRCSLISESASLLFL